MKIKSTAGNPYHDSLGRFCSAENATRACVCGQYYDVSGYSTEDKKKFVKELAKNKEEYYRQQTENRKQGKTRQRNTEKPKKAPVISKGTPEQRIKRAKERISEHNVTFGNFGKTDRALIADNLELFAELQEKYPLLSEKQVRISTNADMKKHVERIYTENTGRYLKVRGALGKATAKVWDDVMLDNTLRKGYALSFKESAYKDGWGHEYAEKYQVETGFHSDTGDCRTAAFRHEYGHLVFMDIGERTRKSDYQMKREIIAGLKREEVAALTSTYGHHNYAEWLAEAFANGTGKCPNKVGTAAVKYIEKYYSDNGR